MTLQLRFSNTLRPSQNFSDLVSSSRLLPHYYHTWCLTWGITTSEGSLTWRQCGSGERHSNASMSVSDGGHGGNGGHNGDKRTRQQPQRQQQTTSMSNGDGGHCGHGGNEQTRWRHIDSDKTTMNTLTATDGITVADTMTTETVTAGMTTTSGSSGINVAPTTAIPTSIV
jgi:hypothetical protein